MATKKNSLIKKILLYLACISVLLIAIVGCGMEDTEVITQKINSPDNEYVAFSWVSMSGGAAGSCGHFISIIKIPKDKPVDFSYSTSTTVFSVGGCGESSFEWANNSTLNVNYSDAEISRIGEEKPLNDDGKIQIRYIPKPSKKY